MTNNHARPVARSNGTTGSQGVQGETILNTPIGYKKFSEPKTEKSSSCRCSTCDIIQDFNFEYYNNVSILRDNDKSVHIMKVVN